MSLNSKEITTLLELLSSRICHDLVSPVGAINNGLEFMTDVADDPDSLKEAQNLIQHSANSAGARLMAFRLAYGAGGRDGNIKAEDIQKAFGALIRTDGKVRQSWDPYGPLGIAKDAHGFAKTLMSTLMMAQDCLTKGGTVYVDAGQGEETLIKAEGAGANVREHVEEALAGTLALDQIDPRLVHPYVLGLSARSMGYTIALVSKDTDTVVWAIRRTATSSSPMP